MKSTESTIVQVSLTVIKSDMEILHGFQNCHTLYQVQTAFNIIETVTIVSVYTTYIIVVRFILTRDSTEPVNIKSMFRPMKSRCEQFNAIVSTHHTNSSLNTI